MQCARHLTASEQSRCARMLPRSAQLGQSRTGCGLHAHCCTACMACARQPQRSGLTCSSQKLTSSPSAAGAHTSGSSKQPALVLSRSLPPGPRIGQQAALLRSATHPHAALPLLAGKALAWSRDQMHPCADLCELLAAAKAQAHLPAGQHPARARWSCAASGPARLSSAQARLLTRLQGGGGADCMAAAAGQPCCMSSAAWCRHGQQQW